MDKKQLVNIIASSVGISESEADTFLNDTFETILKNVPSECPIEIPLLDTFLVSHCSFELPDLNEEVQFTPEERTALLHWFAVAKNSSMLVTEQAYKKGILNRLKAMTYSYYMNKGVMNVTLYRWESDLRDNRVLEAWTPNKQEAELYKELRSGRLLTKVFDIQDIVLDTRISDMYNLYWDEELGMIPGCEVIVANKCHL